MDKPIIIARFNIAHLRHLLNTATDATMRETISRRLAEEEAKLAALERRGGKTM